MNIECYLRNQLRSEQWNHVLFCMAREMESHLDSNSLQGLMYKAGARMADGFPVEGKDSLDAVEVVLNDIWESCKWGWVRLSDQGNCIRIEHAFSPLDEAFGESADGWSVQLLCGFYDSVFRQLGAGDDLRLRRITGGSANRDVLLFELQTS